MFWPIGGRPSRPRNGTLVLVPIASRDVDRLSSSAYQFPISAGLIFDDISGNRTRRNRIWRGEVHLAGAAAPGKVAVLRADDNLIGASRNSGASINAGSATWLDEAGSGLFKNLDVALPPRILARLLRAKLNPELHVLLRHDAPA